MAKHHKYIEKTKITSNGNSYFPPEENAGLSILSLKSHLWKNGFLNVIGVPFPPPNVNGPFGYGNELDP